MDSDWWNTIQYNSSTRMFERHFHVRDRSKLFGARVVRKGAPLNLKEQWALPMGAWDKFCLRTNIDKGSS